jgi:large subunit ribosomal protein L14
MGGARWASLGDEIVCVVKKARPMTEVSSANAGKVKKGDVLRGLVVRTKSPVRRMDGTRIEFEDNAIVMLNKQGQPVGNRILGVIANECRQKRWAKVVSMAPKIV